MTLETGNIAPDFTAPTDNGGTLTLSDLRGKNIVLYFYPKDDTPGCTTEAKDFRDHIKEFEAENTVVIGLSKDPVAKHDKFKAKYDLPFALISDEDVSICKKYETWVEKSMYGKKYMGIQRDTFLIDTEGKIINIWRKAKVKTHIQEVLEAVKNI